jgi:glycerol-3-phosphate dehydrogenase
MSENILVRRKKVLKRLSSEKFDLVVIGGGITGAGIAWDAALRGLTVALIEKEDFGSGTSGGSSKLVHAGIRYLAYGEFSLVWHASRERQWLLSKCPHITKPLPFIIPQYSDGKYNFIKLFFAGWAYDILAKFKNTKMHKFLSKKKILQKVPNIKSDTLKRGLYYWDGLMDDCRVTLETALATEKAGGLIANHLEVIAFQKDKNEKMVSAIQVKDNLGQVKPFDIQSKLFVNATGPWTDETIQLLDYPSKLLLPSKGIHIVTKRFIEEDIAIVITADDDRNMFVIPFRENYSLIGTTDTFYNKDLDNVDVTEEDIDYVISAVNNDFPNSITKKDVISAISGVRPLIISEDAESETDTSRDYEIFETLDNLLTITGGKYTIFRYMAEDLVNKAIEKLGYNKKQYSCLTKNSFLHGGDGIENMDIYVEEHTPEIKNEYNIEQDIAEHLVHTYGSAHPELLVILDEKPEMTERITKKYSYILAEIEHAVKNEWCLTLSDFMIRRTQLQLLEHQGLDCAEKVANIMADYLGWSDREKKKQFTSYKQDLVWQK